MSDRLRAMNDAELGDALSGAGRPISDGRRRPRLAPVRRRDDPRARNEHRRWSLPACPCRAVAARSSPWRRCCCSSPEPPSRTKLVIELGAVAIEVLPGRPDALPSNVVTDVPLGREIPLAEGRRDRRLPGRPALGLGAPARTWVDEAIVGFEPEVVGRRIVSAWPPTSTLPRIDGTDVGAVLMQFEGPWQVASKLLSERDERLRHDAGLRLGQAFWTMRGARAACCSPTAGSRRLLVTGNVLIWQEGGFTFRLETALGRASRDPHRGDDLARRRSGLTRNRSASPRCT